MRLRIPRESAVEHQWDLITDFHRTGETEILGEHKQNLNAPAPKRKEQLSHKRLSQSFVSMFGSLRQRHGSTVACHGVRNTNNSSPQRCGMLA